MPATTLLRSDQITVLDYRCSAGPIRRIIEQGLGAIKKTLEGASY